MVGTMVESVFPGRLAVGQVGEARAGSQLAGWGHEVLEVQPPRWSTGYLMAADRHGQFRSVVSELDRPTTFELIGETAYVITITGKVLRVTGLGR